MFQEFSKCVKIIESMNVEVFSQKAADFENCKMTYNQVADS